MDSFVHNTEISVTRQWLLTERYDDAAHTDYLLAKSSGLTRLANETNILRSTLWSFYYARDIVKGRWPEAEPTIRRNVHYWKLYLDSVIEN